MSTPCYETPPSSPRTSPPNVKKLRMANQRNSHRLDLVQDRNTKRKFADFKADQILVYWESEDLLVGKDKFSTPPPPLTICNRGNEIVVRPRKKRRRKENTKPTNLFG